ncbi:MAG: peptidylprolyl isomerase [Firmicutes bacterium]|uniref:Peptidyl-prolyl cis-trans isomerase n=1 Tax=Candidatus Scatoplasma merdavium TaxID=2840932 RepID=A0A9D9GS41_9BACL|nr:peptidylprolyl isomerase [Candidatus Scatoplasma merdavium]
MVKINVKNFGTLVVEMDYEAAKNTAANFVQLANQGFYDGLKFHRVIKNFVIQAGDGELNHKFVDYSIKGEFAQNGVENNLKHVRGTISMARSYLPNSASSQFFICVTDQPHLDGAYAAFGKLVEGFDVLDKIASVPTDSQDCPIEDVVIESCEVIDEELYPVEKIKELFTL